MEAKVKCPKCGAKFKATWEDVGSALGNFSLPKVPMCVCGMPISPENIDRSLPRVRRATSWVWRQLNRPITCPWLRREKKQRLRAEPACDRHQCRSADRNLRSAVAKNIELIQERDERLRLLAIAQASLATTTAQCDALQAELKERPGTLSMPTCAGEAIQCKPKKGKPTEWKHLDRAESGGGCYRVKCTDCPVRKEPRMAGTCTPDRRKAHEHRWPSGTVGKGKPEFRKVDRPSQGGTTAMECASEEKPIPNVGTSGEKPTFRPVVGEWVWFAGRQGACRVTACTEISADRVAQSRAEAHCRPLDLSEVKTEEHAKQFYGRKVRVQPAEDAPGGLGVLTNWCSLGWRWKATDGDEWLNAAQYIELVE